MKKFSFKLATPLKLKLLEEDRQKAVVSNLVREHEENLKVLEKLKDSLKQIQNKLGDELKGQQGTTLDIHKLSIIQDYIPVLTEKITAQKEQAELSLNRLQEARHVLTKLMQDRKVLEKLKEKALAEYNEEMKKEEQKLLDDLANANFFKRN